eukprot:CAMPEP_0175682358 /NCGR_PEP_ID=MMETSP0097-20121207/25773_1 /TAXON_ID=311494 /ORGANISM="Alexandrium monilatum, Strain CCMP3105" /LENGTH=62 /DNA_ID=CAMNT_0016989239 /DNA_START=78 /DNA_END=262 /DNA_ORIENTATION=-
MPPRRAGGPAAHIAMCSSSVCSAVVETHLFGQVFQQRKSLHLRLKLLLTLALVDDILLDDRL